MKRLILFLVPAFLLLSCKKETPAINERINEPEISKVKLADPISSNKIKNDTIQPYTKDSMVINKRKFVITWNEDNAFIINSKKDTIYTLQNSGLNFPKIIDYNKDGYLDIIFLFFCK